MAPSAVPVEGYPVRKGAHEEELRPVKRVKRQVDGLPGAGDGEDDSIDVAAIPAHPLGVKPLGNAYTATSNDKTFCGGFLILPDELLLQLLEYLDAEALVSLGQTCKALYAFTRVDELWKTLFIESGPSDFEWRGTWRSSYLKLNPTRISKIQCSNLFSDAIHRPYFCANTPLSVYAAGIPSQNAIARLDDLTHADYCNGWTDKPFILTSPVKEWPVYRDWTPETLLEKFPEVQFRAEAVDWPLRKYYDYMVNSNDESPLYLFDRAFVEKTGATVGRGSEKCAYWSPDCFGDDLFAVLEEQRPDSRWMIMGPERSGSTFHKDPNGTSAWNAILTGSKYWLMFPSSPTIPPPPGIIISPDASEITSPLSIAEYLLNFHALARSTPGCKEGICHAGEVLHVPGGWFHLVLNLEDSLALTQNFVPESKLGNVLAFLKDQSGNVSGFRDEVEDPYALFVERLGERYPHLLERGLEDMERVRKAQRGKWEALKSSGQEDGGESGGDGGGFSFGFGFDSDVEEEVA